MTRQFWVSDFISQRVPCDVGNSRVRVLSLLRSRSEFFRPRRRPHPPRRLRPRRRHHQRSDCGEIVFSRHVLNVLLGPTAPLGSNLHSSNKWRIETQTQLIVFHISCRRFVALPLELPRVHPSWSLCIEEHDTRDYPKLALIHIGVQVGPSGDLLW